MARTADFDHARCVAVSVAGRVVRAGGGDAVAGEALGDREEPLPREVLGEDALHDRARRPGRLEPVETLAVGRLARVRVRAGVGEPVAVGRSAAEEPTLVLRLGRHGRADPDLDPVALTLATCRRRGS